MRPKILRNRLRGDWSVVSCEETTQYLFKGINASFSTPNINKMDGREIGGVNVNQVGAVVPNTGGEGIRFIGSSRDHGNRIVSMDEGIYDEMEGDNNNV